MPRKPSEPGKRRRPSKKDPFDLTVKSMSEMLLDNPEHMTLEKAANTMGLSFAELTREQRQDIVRSTILQSWENDETKRAFVQSIRMKAAVEALAAGDMKAALEVARDIAAEPGVGLNSRLPGEQVLDITILLPAIEAAMKERPAVLDIPATPAPNPPTKPEESK